MKIEIRIDDVIVLATPHRRHDALQESLVSNGIDVVRVESREDLTAARLDVLKPRYVFFPHWSWKIPAEIYERHECVIFHMSDVPFGRGGSPLQNLVVRGFKETKLSALRCVAEMDAGPVYLKETLSLLGTADEILARAADLMVGMIVQIVRDNPAPTPQEGEPTIFKRRQAEDGNIVGLESIEQVYDYIRMLEGEGYPPAFLETSNLRLEFSRAVLASGEVCADVRIRKK